MGYPLMQSSLDDIPAWSLNLGNTIGYQQTTTHSLTGVLSLLLCAMREEKKRAEKKRVELMTLKPCGV